MNSVNQLKSIKLKQYLVYNLNYGEKKSFLRKRTVNRVFDVTTFMVILHTLNEFIELTGENQNLDKQVSYFVVDSFVHLDRRLLTGHEIPEFPPFTNLDKFQSLILYDLFAIMIEAFFRGVSVPPYVLNRMIEENWSHADLADLDFQKFKSFE